MRWLLDAYSGSGGAAGANCAHCAFVASPAAAHLSDILLLVRGFFACFLGYQQLQIVQRVSQRQLFLKVAGSFAQPLSDCLLCDSDFTLYKFGVRF